MKHVGIAAAATAIFMATPAAAQESTGWAIEKSTAGCTLITAPDFPGARTRITRDTALRISSDVAVIHRDSLRSHPGAKDDGIATPTGPANRWTVGETVEGPAIAGLYVERSDDMVANRVHAQVRGTLDDALVARLSAQARPTLIIRGKVLGAYLELPPLAEGLRLLAACEPDRMQANLPLRPRGDARSWAPTGPDMLAATTLGTLAAAEYELSVGTDGRVTECRTLRSTGDAHVDRTVCARLRARGRFDPPTDAAGRVIEGRYRHTTPALRR